MKTENISCSQSLKYLLKSLLILLVTLTGFITYSYLFDSDSDTVSYNEASKFIHNIDNPTYVLDSSYDNSDKVKRYNNKLAGLISFNDETGKPQNLYSKSIDLVSVKENIYFIFSPLRSPPFIQSI